MKNKIKRSLRVSRYVLYKETLVDTKEHFWSFIGAFFGIGCIAFLQSLHFSEIENIFLVGSFGASCVLVYGAIQSPLAQPRNLVGGHVLSAFIGVTVAKFSPDIIWIKAPLAVALSIVFMQISKTLHPPGGATALIAIIGTEKVKSLGYWYVINPILSGALILLIIALIFNNITKKRKYPTDRNFTKSVQKIFFLKRKKRNKRKTI